MTTTFNMPAFVQHACNVHDETNQKYANMPYSTHIMAVVSEAVNNLSCIDNIDENTKNIIIFGAAFHDAIEDARLTYNDVLKIANKYFSKEDAVTATEISYALTNEKGRNRAERANEKYYEGIRNTKYASYVKFCDRLANYKFSKAQNARMCTVYEKEMPEFLDHIGATVEMRTIMSNVMQGSSEFYF